MPRQRSKMIKIGIMGLVSVASFGIAHAHAVPGTAGTVTPDNGTSSFDSGSWNASWQNLTAPFQNFTRSLQSIGTTNLGVKIPTVPVFSDVASETAHDAFGKFDAWLAGIIGFHISQIFVVFLELMSWLLGGVKNVVDWILSWIH